MGPPAGANNYLKWRRTIDEHLELRRLSWNEYGMFSWLCTKAAPHVGTLRTSWPTLAAQTGLSATFVERLCRGLRTKGYICYPHHRGSRRRLMELAIDKFPLSDGTYTALGPHSRAGATQLLAHLTTELPSGHLSELDLEKLGNSTTSTGRRSRERRRTEEDPLRVRCADADRGSEKQLPRGEIHPDPKRAAPALSGAHAEPTRAGAVVPGAASPGMILGVTDVGEGLLAKAQALAAAPAILRETLELFFLKTRREHLHAGELEAIGRLEAAHTPAVIQRAITRSAERLARRGEPASALTLDYVWRSLQHFTTRSTPARAASVPLGARTKGQYTHVAQNVAPNPTYPTGLTRLW
jgi:hypothetical protein